VIDGDTLDTAAGRIRLYGINAPERGTECAPEATARFQELAEDGIRIERGPRWVDSYGRGLAYLYTEGGQSVDETLIREGLAQAWEGDGQHRDVLMAAERNAQQQSTGCLW
jgi:micrococcal nuclease